MSDQFLRSYPGHASFAAGARRDVRAFAARGGFTTEEADDIGSAIGEILVVAVQRADGPSTAFHVAAQAFADRLEIQIETGSARFGRRMPMPAVDSLAPRGLGMQIIRKLVTQVSFSDSGRKVHLVKRRSYAADTARFASQPSG